MTRETALGYLFALGAAACYGATHVLARFIVGQVPPLVGSAFALLFGVLVLTAAAGRDVLRDRGVPRRALLWIALSGVSASFGVTALYLAMDRAPVVVVSPISGVYPLVSVLLASLFLGRLERVTWRIWSGVSLVVGGIVLVLVGGQV